jgi:hypothetical protein
LFNQLNELKPIVPKKYKTSTSICLSPTHQKQNQENSLFLEEDSPSQTSIQVNLNQKPSAKLGVRFNDMPIVCVDGASALPSKSKILTNGSMNTKLNILKKETTSNSSNSSSSSESSSDQLSLCSNSSSSSSISNDSGKHNDSIDSPTSPSEYCVTAKELSTNTNKTVLSSSVVIQASQSRRNSSYIATATPSAALPLSVQSSTLIINNNSNLASASCSRRVSLSVTDL